ncbi:MAG: EAL domain-containing protein [Pseudomonadota bacterium]|uniref:EAL domain-containing protein n=1 Tax=Alcanivorax sp. NBRC 102024 TaxID=1113895 RepID=UPI000789C201|nr:EAL domain-containing protein [Alcanivorax sp. NBRC 102024]MEE2603483.1 EAL domain-containing protein [Pseudomonadota bacterium]
MQALLIGAAMGVLALVAILFRRERAARTVLAAREKRYRLTMEHSAIPMALMGPDGRWLAVNRALCRLSGYREEELLQSSFQQLIYPDDLQNDLQQLGSLLSGRVDSLRLEKRYITRTGELVWVRLSIAGVSEDGRVRYLIVQCEDIQAAKEAEHALAESRRQLQLALSAGGVGIWQYNTVTGRLDWDERIYEMYGVKPGQEGDGTLKIWYDRIHPDDLALLRPRLQQVMQAPGELDGEFRILTPAGEERYIRARAETTLIGPDKIPLMVGTNWDVTAERAMQHSLAHEKESLRVTLNSIADGVIATDHDGRITFMNPVAESLTGWREREAEGAPVDTVLQLTDEEGRPTRTNPIAVALRGGDMCFLREDCFLLSRDGSRYEIQDSAAPVKTGDGEVKGAVMVFRDVSARRAMQKKLRYHATHDALTGLTNRREFENTLQQTLDEGGVEQSVLCFIDLDRFKVVNDTAGHVAGDALLRECARVIGRQIRDEDVVARLGGDEFGLLLHNCPADRAVQIAERLIAALGEIRFAWKDSLYDIGASVGLVQLDGNLISVEEAMSRADVACYAAKHRGRNQVSVYTPDDSEASRRHLELQMAAGLRESLESDRFLLYAQEIRPIGGETAASHYEILLRLRDRNGDILNPGAFIPAAERYQMMTHIDRWVLTQLLVTLSDELAALPNLHLAVNLSATSLDDPTFIPFLEDLLDRSTVAPERLTFEITETTVVNQLSSASELLARIREKGSKVALDDFGSGFSSFNYLKHFQVDFIKIDGSFVRNLLYSSVDRTIVESISEVAHRLGVKTVAEYVEDIAMIPVLQEAGVDFVQGYAIGRPQPLSLLFEQLEGLSLSRHRQLRLVNRDA